MKYKKVKVVCGGCIGNGDTDDVEYETGKTIKVVCHACNGILSKMGLSIQGCPKRVVNHSF